MLNLQRLMYKCVQDSLASLGEPTMQSLIWHMSRSGVPVDPENFDIKKFYVALSELIDGGADVMLVWVDEYNRRRSTETRGRF